MKAGALFFSNTVHHLNFLKKKVKKQFTFFSPLHQSSLGSCALLLMVFFITGWSIQLRLIEHKVGSICEAIYQGEGARLRWSPPAVIICAFIPAASGTPEPQRRFTKRASKQEERTALPSPPLKGCIWLQVILANLKFWIYFNVMPASCCNTIKKKKKGAKRHPLHPKFAFPFLLLGLGAGGGEFNSLKSGGRVV